MQRRRPAPGGVVVGDDTINTQPTTRIGFAYNEKPEPVAPQLVNAGETPSADEEPPSRRRDEPSRTSGSPATRSQRAGAAFASPSTAMPHGPAPHAPTRPPADDDRYAEWDAVETIDAVADALGALGEVVRLEATPDFPERLRAERPDIVFNIAEGLDGVNREAHVPAICEFFGIPYSGSDPFTLSLCLDKARTKEVLSYHGVPTAPFTLVRSHDELNAMLAQMREGGGGRARRVPASIRPEGTRSHPAPRLPLFVKPLHEGSSKGITEKNLCRTRAELGAQVAFLLESYDQPVLVESFLPGAEFTCGVIGNGVEARVLPIVEMNFGALPDGATPIYGFEAKWVWDTREQPLEIFECPARIGASLQRAIEQVVLRTYEVLGCRDWSRIDVRLDAAGVPNVVEVNPLPGILPDPADNSCLPKAARAAGIGYDELIQRCLRAAAARCGVSLAERPGYAAADVA